MYERYVISNRRYGLFAGSLLSGYYFLRTRLEQLLLYKRHYRWMLYGKPYGAVLTLLKDLVEDGKVVPIVDGVYRWAENPPARSLVLSLSLSLGVSV